MFGVSAATSVRYVAEQRDSGSVTPKAQGRPPGRFGKLAAQMDFLIEVVRAEPDITLRELADALEDARRVRVSLTAVHKALARAGYSYKKRADRAGA